MKTPIFDCFFVCLVFIFVFVVVSLLIYFFLPQRPVELTKNNRASSIFSMPNLFYTPFGSVG